MRDQTKAYCFALATVLLWSTVATAFKLSLEHLDPYQLLLWATLASLACLGAVLAVQGKLRLVLRGTRREYLFAASMGILNPLAYYLVLFQAYDRLPAQEAQCLNYTWAITLALLSIPLLGQRIARAEILAAIVSYTGALVIATHGNVTSLSFSDGPGVALALGSTVLWALYWIANTRDRRDPVVGLFQNFLFGLPWVFLACTAFSDPFHLPLPGLLGAGYVGAFEMGFTFVLWLSALKLSENTARVGNLIFLSPFLSLIFIHFLLGETVLPSTFVGLGLIVAGLLVQRAGKSA